MTLAQRGCILMASVMFACAPALAQVDGQPGVTKVIADEVPVVVVTGRASIGVPADEVRIAISVETQGAEPQDVIKDNSRRVSRVLDAIQRKGAGRDEVSTGWFSIQPIYSQRKPTDRAFVPAIVGYRVNNTVIVKTGKLQLAGDIVQAAVDAGANRIDSVSFGLAEERAKRSEVLREAVANARADADAALAAAGAELGEIHSMTIDSAGLRRPPSFGFGIERVSAGVGASVPPMIPGEIQVSASVTIEFEIVQ